MPERISPGTLKVRFMNQKSISTHDLCVMAVFTAIIAVMAQIVIPMPLLVPMTLQTLGIALAGVMLGVKRGTLSVLVYVLAGALGAPVFAGMTGGLGTVFGPTGGFILSFPLLALVAGIGAEKSLSSQNQITSALWLWSGIITGISINYICGAVYYSQYTSNDLITSFTACVLVFIPTDIIKILIAGLFGLKIRSILPKRIISG